MGSRNWRVATVASAAFLIALISGCSTQSSPGSTLALTSTPDAAQLQAVLSGEFERLGIDPARSVSAAPGEDCRPLNLTVVVEDPDGEGGESARGLKLSWVERVVGDYDANGEVGISDLSPLGLHFGKAVSYDVSGTPSGDPLVSPNWSLARVDGDANGEINLGDITTIAINWQERLDGFNVYRMGPGETEYTLLVNEGGALMTLPRSEAVADTPVGLVMYEFLDEIYIEGDYQSSCCPGTASTARSVAAGSPAHLLEAGQPAASASAMCSRRWTPMARTS